MNRMMQKAVAVLMAVIFASALAGCSSGKKASVKDIKDKAEIIIPFEYVSIDFFGDELYAVKKEGGKFGVIDVNGNVIVEPLYESFEPVIAGDKVYYFAKTVNNDGVTTEVLFDANGKQVDDMDAVGVSDLYVAYGDNNIDHEMKAGYKSRRTGEWVIGPLHDKAYEFHDGIAIVGVDYEASFDGLNGQGGITMTETNHGYIKENGDYLLEKRYGKLVDFNSGRGVLPVTIENESRVNLDLPLVSWLTGIDTSNVNFKNKDTYYAFIDTDGYVIDEKLWFDTLGYDNGFAYVQEKKRGKWSVIDINGDIVKDSVYSSVRRIDYGLYEVKEDNSGTAGLADNKGDIMIRPSMIFDDIWLDKDKLKQLDDNLYLFENSYKYYIINNNEINSQTKINDLKNFDSTVLGYVKGNYAVMGDDLVFINDSGSEVLRIRGYSDEMRNDQFVFYINGKAGVIKPVL